MKTEKLTGSLDGYWRASFCIANKEFAAYGLTEKESLCYLAYILKRNGEKL